MFRILSPKFCNLYISGCFKNCLRHISNPLSNFYEVLGLAPRSSEDKVKNAYYELSKQYHPDKNMGNDAASQKILEINEAFEVLGNKTEKEKYDNKFFPPQIKKKSHFLYEHAEIYNSPFYNKTYRRKSNIQVTPNQYRSHLKGEVKRKQRHMAQKYSFCKYISCKKFSNV